MAHNEKNRQWLDAAAEARRERIASRRIDQEEYDRREKLSGRKCRDCELDLRIADHEDGFCRRCSNTVNY